MRDQRPAVRPYEGQEASRREASFLTNLSSAQDDFDWIVANEAWVKLGHETFAGWWEARVQPIMRGLSMRPSRELALEAAERIRAEEAHLPPSQRRRELELAETVGTTRDELRAREGRSTSGGIPPKVDLRKHASADVPEEDHRDAKPGDEDGADARPSSDVQPPADDVSNDVGSDETAPKDEAPRQSSGPVELPQEQPATGVSVAAPAGDPEHSGRSGERGRAAVSVPAPPDLEKARRSEALAKWALNTPEGRAQAKRALVNEWISSTWEFLDEVGPDVFVQVADAGMHEDMDRLITAVTGWVAAKKANSGIRLVKGA